MQLELLFLKIIIEEIDQIRYDIAEGGAIFSLKLSSK